MDPGFGRDVVLEGRLEMIRIANIRVDQCDPFRVGGLEFQNLFRLGGITAQANDANLGMAAEFVAGHGQPDTAADARDQSCHTQLRAHRVSG
jgi:hypothetical protein